MYMLDLGAQANRHYIAYRISKTSLFDHIWAATWDFQQYVILSSVYSDEPVQQPSIA